MSLVHVWPSVLYCGLLEILNVQYCNTERQIFLWPHIKLSLYVTRLQFDYAELHVTAFWRINGADCSWSYYNIINIHSTSDRQCTTFATYVQNTAKQLLTAEHTVIDMDFTFTHTEKLFSISCKVVTTLPTHKVRWANTGTQKRMTKLGSYSTQITTNNYIITQKTTNNTVYKLHVHIRCYVEEFFHKSVTRQDDGKQTLTFKWAE